MLEIVFLHYAYIQVSFCVFLDHFSSFMQAMNEYRGSQMSTEVVADRNLLTETVDRRWK